jgi:putative acetyltransferase
VNADLSLRDMVAADLPELTDLWVAVWQKAVPRIDFETRRVWFVDRMAAHRAAGARTIVALHGGAIVGFVVVDPATGYLDQIVAADAWQRRGLASALLDAAKAAAPSGIDLHVNQDNARALRFYEKHGFAVSGEDINPNSGAPIYKMSWRP